MSLVLRYVSGASVNVTLVNHAQSLIYYFQLGPLLLSPFSEIYGRQVVLNCANVWLSAWQLPCALATDVGGLIAYRFLAGAGGSVSLTLGGGVISDLFPVTQRGLANSLFTIGPLFGPVLGPLLGGLISGRAGWRWVYWVLLAACGMSTVLVMLLCRETNAAVLLRKKTKLLTQAQLTGVAQRSDFLLVESQNHCNSSSHHQSSHSWRYI
jgi:multidrug resistance protein